MKVICNNHIPFKGFMAINLFGILLLRRDCASDFSDTCLMHEEIHSAQMKELGYLPFYLIYLAEWLVNLFRFRFDTAKAYRNISMEKEAYSHQDDLDYLSTRKHFAQWR